MLHSTSIIKPILLVLACMALAGQHIVIVSGNKLSYVYWRNATKRAIGTVVPKPKYTNFKYGPNDYLEIKPEKFRIELEDLPELKQCSIFKLALRRYIRRLMFDDVATEKKDNSSGGGGRKLDSMDLLWIGLRKSPSAGVAPKFKCELLPHADMDESYELALRPRYNGMSVLLARTNWGLLRGLETLSQLIYQLEPGKNDRGTFAIRAVQVIDEPRFKHRGFMLDTARHYISLEKISKTLDAMAYNKMNVFHWHIVDDQSFPFESEAYPQLAKSRAYRPNMTYSKEDVQEIILYAAIRGIRVIPELDTPGHSYSMLQIPGLLSECYDPETKQKNGDFGPIDPTKATAYKAVNRLLDEFSKLFVDSHFHAGGDEVDFDCWKSNPDISQWMASRDISGNYEELSNYYINRLHNLVTKEHNKTMLVWQEVYDMGAHLPNDSSTVIHVWKHMGNEPEYMSQLARVVDSGYQALLSSCWYLNLIDYGQDWLKFYQCDPRGSPIKEERKHQVLGGEACMWTEFVDDTNVISRSWPRASAAAERLWSPIETKDVDEFLHRLEQHRCRLLNRGITAEPVNGPGYC